MRMISRRRMRRLMKELDRTELRSDLDRALATLPASLREAFVMKHVEGRSYEEMADLLGTTVEL